MQCWVKSIFILFLLLFTAFTGWSQTFYTEATTYTWTNKTSVPVYMYVPGGFDVHRVVLSVNVGDTNAHDYFLTYPNGNTDYITVGSAFNTNTDPTLGYSVSFLKTATAGIYELTIIKNPSTSGVWSSAEVFGLTLDKLGTTNTLSTTISFYQLGASPPTITQPAGIIPNGSYWADSITSATTATAYFQLRGADVTGSVHRVNLWLITDSTPTYFNVRANTYGSQLATPTTVNLTNQTSINTNIGGSTTGVHLQLTNISTGLYQMEIVANPATCPVAGTDCEFDNNEMWQFSIDFPSGHKTVLSMQPLTYNSQGITPDPLILYRAPLSVIRNPGNIYTDNPSKVVVNRAFRYTSDPFDADTSDTSLAYQWVKDSTNFTSHGTEQNPDFNDTFAATGSHTIELSVSETYSISGTFPYADFTHSTKDKLSLSVVDPEYVLFPPHVNLPYTTGDPPTIDGVVTADFTDTSINSTSLGDTGWNQAHLIAYQDGTAPHVLVQTLRNKNTATQKFVYYSFEVRNDPTIDQYDSIIMCLSPDNSAATREDDRIIAIYPFSSSPVAGSDQLPQTVKVKKWNATAVPPAWEWETLTATAGTYQYNIQAKVNNFGGTTGAWNVEVRLPTSTDAASGGTAWVNVADEFLYSFIVFRADTSSGAPAVAEFKWPKASDDVLGDAENYDYNPAWWSVAEKGAFTTGSYNGLSFTWASILVTPTVGANPAGSPGTNITLPNCGDADTNNNSVLNTFAVTLQNNSMRAGNYVALKNIKVGFRVAKWGIPGAASWIIVPSYLDTPVVANPVTGQTVAAGTSLASATTTVNLPWTVNCTDSDTDLNTPDDAWILANYPGTHHCVYVEVLEAAIDDPTLTTPQAANVLVSKMYRNFNFVTASEYREKAIIGTKGNKRPKDGSNKYRIRLSVNKHAWAVEKSDPDLTGRKVRPSALKPFGAGASNDANEADTTSYLSWSAAGYAFTGRTVVLRNTPLELLDPLGSFGMVAEHKAEVLGWEDGISGAEEAAPDTYEMEVPVNGEKAIEVRLAPIEPTPFSLSLHAGAATPLTAFNGNYMTAICAIFDAQYRFTAALSLIFMAGFNWMPAAATGASGTIVLNFSLGPRATAHFTPDLYGYLQAGFNLYIQGFSAFYYGGSAGAGLGLKLSPRFSVELGADWHYTNVQYMLLQTHLGVVLRL